MRRGLVSLLALLAAGCASLPGGEATLPPASDNTAVVALLDNAKQEATSGRLESAAANLERALRIEPRNPMLWHELARIRLDQAEPQQTVQLAMKSNTLAGENNRLRAENWRLIGQARAQSGDQQGAEAAFSKADSLDGKR